jgi:hypothetical protein
VTTLSEKMPLRGSFLVKNPVQGTESALGQFLFDRLTALANDASETPNANGDLLSLGVLRHEARRPCRVSVFAF